MLVDDKLAKEKLISEVHRINANSPRKELSGIQVAQLIRNTDLTDCQPQKAKAMNEHSSGTRATVPPSAIPSGMDVLTVRRAIVRVEDRVAELDGFAKRCADKGDYSNAAAFQKGAVDLHCAVDIIKGRHVCGIRDFSTYHGDVCDRCVLDAELAVPPNVALGKAETVARQNEQDGVPDQGSVRNATDMERMHGLIEQLAGRFKGYLPWPDNQRDSVVRSHEKFIEDTIRKADAIRALPVLEDKKD